jgi:hypothetical protein
MVSQPTPDPLAARTGDPLYRLDYLTLTPTRAALVSRAIADLVAQLVDDDLAILPHLQRCKALLDAPSPSRVAPPQDQPRKDHVSSTIRLWHDTAQSQRNQSLSYLVAVLVNAALDPDRAHITQKTERNHIADLAEIVRGACKSGERAPILALIGGVDSVRGLIRHVDERLASSSRIHSGFKRLWKKWLRDCITSWTEKEPWRQWRVLEVRKPLVQDLDAPSLDLEPGTEIDDCPVVTSVAIDHNEFEGLPENAVQDKAAALQLLRGSSYGGLVLASDHYVPNELICQLARGALQRAHSTGSVLDADVSLAVALALATALRKIEVHGVVWGSEPTADQITLSLQEPALSVQLKRPAHAVEPSGMDRHLKPVTQHFVWPIPRSLHAALQRLAPTHDAIGTPVFRHWHADGDRGNRLRDVISELLPGAHFASGKLRMAFAAKLSQQFGPEIAQWVMRDSLFTSLGPAYYASASADEVGKFVAGVQADWFGEPVAAPPPTGRAIGSNLTLHDTAAQLWSRDLQKKAYSAARKKGGALESLRAERNRLAGALAAATGHRPNDRLGLLHLDSVIPEYGLVILEDKQEDALRRTRIAATGQRWPMALRAYLDTVVALAQGDDAHLADWAKGVLESRYPLFSMPGMENAEPLPFTANELRSTMPAELAGVSNFYRHRLNQALQAHGVDWELRHAQLGWIVSPAFATADLSPLSPQLLAERLAPAIDKVLVQDGWYPPNQRVDKWSWEGIPERSLVDWSERSADYQRHHESATRQLRQDFERRSGELKPQILECLAKAVDRCLPRLRVDIAQHALAKSPGYHTPEPVALTSEHYALLRDWIQHERRDAYTAVDGIVAERLIHDLVVRAVRENIVTGNEPTYHRIGFTSQLSPFMPGMGLAVRQTEALRIRIGELARHDRRGDRAGLVQLAILASTPYRDLRRSALLTKAAAKVTRGASHPGWLRVPTADGQDELPMLLSGVAGAILARSGERAPTMKPMAPGKFADWLFTALHDVFPDVVEASELPARVAKTCWMAGLIELDGPGRLVLEDHPLAAVGTDRALAESEAWPARTHPVDADDEDDRQPIKAPPSNDHPLRHRLDTTLYTRLTTALNPASPTAEGKTGSRRGWRNKMARELRAIIADAGAKTNLGLLAQFALHRLQFGGVHVKHLKASTLHKEITRFGRELLTVLGPSALTTLSLEQLETVYLATLCGKPGDVRADVLEEIIKFQHYLEFAHGMQPLPWANLQRYAGPRIRRADKGTLTQAEIDLILGELKADLEREQQRVDASPEAIRLCELRVVLFVLLEGSGLRPGSVYGLLFGDIHLLGDGRDFVHVHTTGGYGSAKTSTTQGFIPLEGPLWIRERIWIMDWLAREKVLRGSEGWKTPLFGDAPGSKLRFASNHLMSRIHVLVKWACGSKRAHAYWLRKNRMTQRLRDVQDAPTPTARAVYRALHTSGEADILIPLSHYVHDAAVPLRTYLEVAGRPDRAAVLAATHLRATPLDMKWHKQRNKVKEYFFGTVFDAMNVPVAKAADGLISTAPLLYRQQPLLPLHIDRYARMLQRTADRTEAMHRCGLSDVQADRLDEGICSLARRTGSVPWLTPDIQRPTALMHATRHLQGTDKLFALLGQSPDDWLKKLAHAWARDGHLDAVDGADAVLHLADDQEGEAARMLLDRTGINLTFQRTANGGGLLLGGSAATVTVRGRHNSPANACRWVFGMTWLHNYLVASSAPASSKGSAG